MYINTDCCKGVVNMVGKGGAMRVQSGFVTVIGSRFVNNTAKLLGGSVFIDLSGNITLRDSYFESSVSPGRHSLQGDIVYSDGNLTLDNVALNASGAMDGVSVVRHSSDRWSLDIRDVRIHCPTGYNLRTTNSSAYQVQKNGLITSSKLDQLSYFCESCHRNKYSLDVGYLEYRRTSSKIIHYTLFIDGSSPSASESSGNMSHYNVICHDCPFGGKCYRNIVSITNFWGYRVGNTIEFQRCPKDYCCSSRVCDSVDSCSDFRQGRLCGRCLSGYSQSLYTSVCMKNERCSPYPFLWVGLSSGICYVLILTLLPKLLSFHLQQTALVCSSSAQEILSED